MLFPRLFFHATCKPYATKVLFKLYTGSIQALFRRYQSAIQALFRLYSGSIQALADRALPQCVCGFCIDFVNLGMTISTLERAAFFFFKYNCNSVCGCVGVWVWLGDYFRVNAIQACMLVLRVEMHNYCECEDVELNTHTHTRSRTRTRTHTHTHNIICVCIYTHISI